DEVAGAVRAAVQVALLRRAAPTLAPRGAGQRAGAGRERREQQIEAPYHLGLAADHEAVATLEPPDAAARAAVDVVEAARREPLRPFDVVAVVRVPAVDDDVPGREPRGELVERRVDHRGGHHEPDDPRLGEARDEIVDRRGAGGALPSERLDGGLRAVVHHALVTAA